MHLARAIHLLRYPHAELKHAIEPILKRHGFFAHPVNLLLAMITDERTHFHIFGLLIILKARSQRVAE
mgnify:FL=1